MSTYGLGLHGLAWGTAALMSFVVLVSLIGFGPGAGVETTLALPCLLASLAVPDKQRKLLFLIVGALPFLAIDLPPRRLGITLADLLVGILILLFLSRRLLAPSEGWPGRKTIFTVPLVTLLLVALVSAFFSGYPRPPLAEIAGNLEYVMFYVIILDMVTTVEDAKRLCHLLVIGFIPAVLLAFAQAFAGVALDVKGLNPDSTVLKTGVVEAVRAYGPFTDPLLFGQYLLIPLSLVAALASYARDFLKRAFLVGLFALGTVGLIASLSRGAWLAFLVAAALFAFLRISKGVTIYAVTMLAIAAVGLASYWSSVSSALPPAVVARVADARADLAFDGRGYSWPAALDIVRDRPLFGAGLRNLFIVLPEYAPGLLYARSHLETIGEPPAEVALSLHEHVDSFYLTLVAEIGICGILPVLAIGFLAMRQGLRNYRDGPEELKPYALGILCAFVAMQISFIFTYNYSDGRVALLLWTLLAMTIVLQRLAGSGADS